MSRLICFCVEQNEKGAILRRFLLWLLGEHYASRKFLGTVAITNMAHLALFMDKIDGLVWAGLMTTVLGVYGVADHSDKKLKVLSDAETGDLPTTP